MPRPQKKGLDYFPLDVTMDIIDDNVVMLESKYGVEGFTTLIKLYMKIYQDEGYFIKWNEKSSLLLSKRVNVDNNRVNDIINDLVNWGVFDKELYEKANILTSRRIQKTYITAVYKRKDIEIEESILLLDEVSDNINLINSDIYPQRKEKKRKVDKIKEDNVSSEHDNVPYKEIVSYLNQQTNSQYKSTTSKTQTLIKARFKEGHTLEDFKTVIDVKTKEWLNDTSMNKFLRPETLFGTKFESYLNQSLINGDKPKTPQEIKNDEIVKERYSKYKI